MVYTRDIFLAALWAACFVCACWRFSLPRRNLRLAESVSILYNNKLDYYVLLNWNYLIYGSEKEW